LHIEIEGLREREGVGERKRGNATRNLTFSDRFSDKNILVTTSTKLETNLMNFVVKIFVSLNRLLIFFSNRFGNQNIVTKIKSVAIILIIDLETEIL
jgi:hypothetical protein